MHLFGKRLDRVARVGMRIIWVMIIFFIDGGRSRSRSIFFVDGDRRRSRRRSWSRRRSESSG